MLNRNDLTNNTQNNNNNALDFTQKLIDTLKQALGSDITFEKREREKNSYVKIFRDNAVGFEFACGLYEFILNPVLKQFNIRCSRPILSHNSGYYCGIKISDLNKLTETQQNEILYAVSQNASTFKNLSKQELKKITSLYEKPLKENYFSNQPNDNLWVTDQFLNQRDRSILNRVSKHTYRYFSPKTKSIELYAPICDNDYKKNDNGVCDFDDILQTRNFDQLFLTEAAAAYQAAQTRMNSNFYKKYRFSIIKTIVQTAEIQKLYLSAQANNIEKSQPEIDLYGTYQGYNNNNTLDINSSATQTFNSSDFNSGTATSVYVNKIEETESQAIIRRSKKQAVDFGFRINSIMNNNFLFDSEYYYEAGINSDDKREELKKEICPNDEIKRKAIAQINDLYKKSFAAYSISADLGHIKGSTNLAGFYLKGIMIPEEKKKEMKTKGREILKKSAIRGHARAQLNLAKIYEADSNLEAIYFYQMAARQFEPYALARVKRFKDYDTNPAAFKQIAGILMALVPDNLSSEFTFTLTDNRLKIKFSNLSILNKLSQAAGFYCRHYDEKNNEVFIDAWAISYIAPRLITLSTQDILDLQTKINTGLQQEMTNNNNIQSPRPR